MQDPLESARMPYVDVLVGATYVLGRASHTHNSYNLTNPVPLQSAAAQA